MHWHCALRSAFPMFRRTRNHQPIYDSVELKRDQRGVRTAILIGNLHAPHPPSAGHSHLVLDTTPTTMAVAIYSVTNNPSPPPRLNLPLPLPLFILMFISFTLAWILLVLSMLDLGYLSMWMNPVMSLLTIIYHLAVLLLSRTKRTVKDPTYFSTVVVCAYLFGIVWFVAFILTNIAIVVRDDRFFSLEDIKRLGLPASVGSQRAQVILTLLEAVVLEAYAIKGHLIIRERGDPEDWRPRTGQRQM
ncbi:hypothetical protein AX15_002308 [Amanita polypyramis BW_CC]|nr:hypothetical protein AX15_002308 [Amanita polypyramis BW_CC]